ncbi:hypothetical protein Bbelb_363760 [Branchiostoma belcheri]|nr:hypothetical protein Bbelb_363760 [Branchiostoma belcheri]
MTIGDNKEVRLLGTMKTFACHRASIPRRKRLSKRRRKKSSAVGCSFRVKIFTPDEESQPLQVRLFPHHCNHTPGSEEDSCYLPVHETVVCCSTDCLGVGMTAQQTSNMLQSMQQSVSIDDWVGTYAKAQRLRDQGVCIFFQEYDPDNKDPDKRPFVLVLQTEWQRQMAERFRPNSVWTVDSTFAMRRQSLTEKRAIERAVQNDPLSWEDGTKCRLLLCWFHVKKAWTENLLPKLDGQMAADVYDRLCELMLQPTWQSFDDNFAQFYAEYEDVQQVTKYLRGWD